MTTTPEGINPKAKAQRARPTYHMVEFKAYGGPEASACGNTVVLARSGCRAARGLIANMLRWGWGSVQVFTISPLPASFRRSELRRVNYHPGHKRYNPNHD